MKIRLSEAKLHVIEMQIEEFRKDLMAHEAKLADQLLLGLWPEYKGMPKGMQGKTLEDLITLACERLEHNRQILERKTND